jgi:aminoglycoside N3'-acetyltransferase
MHNKLKKGDVVKLHTDNSHFPWYHTNTMIVVSGIDPYSYKVAILNIHDEVIEYDCYGENKLVLDVAESRRRKIDKLLSSK